MKREFLSGLKLDTEVIDKIMEEHGKTVNKLKDDLSKSISENKLLGEQVASYKDSTDKVDKLIKDNDKLKNVNEELKTQYDEIQNTLNSTIEKHGKEMGNIAKKQYVSNKLDEDGVIKEFKDYLMSKFDYDKLELDGERIKDFDNIYKPIKETNTKMYQEVKLTGTGSPNQSSFNDDSFKNPFSKEHFNLTEQGNLIKKNPELAEKMSSGKYRRI